MLAAEATHRDHAIVEQVIAELKNGPLAHLPSGIFTANAAWLVCAAISHNPHPRCGCAGRRPPQSHPQRHHPRPADCHSGAAGALRTPPGPAPAPALALRDRARRAVPPRPARPPARRGLTTAPTGPDRRSPVEAPGRPAAQPRPPAHQKQQDRQSSTSKIDGGSRLSLRRVGLRRIPASRLVHGRGSHTRAEEVRVSAAPLYELLFTIGVGVVGRVGSEQRLLHRGTLAGQPRRARTGRRSPA
jgi:hypothetical protein